MSWKVVAEPEGNNPGSTVGKKEGVGKNEGGLVIYLVNGSRKQEVKRVAFERANSIRPKTGLKKAFDDAVKTALQSVELIESLEREMEELEKRKEEIKRDQEQVVENAKDEPGVLQ